VLPFAPPEPLIRSQMNSGAEVYARMHGSSWFVPDGQWSTWDAGPRLAEIAVPALVVGGERDQCVPALSEALAAGLPNAELAILDSAHLPFYEVPEVYFPLIADFLGRVGSSVQG
jgi:proline iminopeptidase